MKKIIMFLLVGLFFASTVYAGPYRGYGKGMRKRYACRVKLKYKKTPSVCRKRVRKAKKKCACCGKEAYLCKGKKAPVKKSSSCTRY